MKIRLIKMFKDFLRGNFSYCSVFLIINKKGQTFWFTVRCLKGTLVKIESIWTHSSKNKKLVYFRVLDGEWTKLWFQFFTEKKNSDRNANSNACRSIKESQKNANGFYSGRTYLKLKICYRYLRKIHICLAINLNFLLGISQHV